MFKIEKHSKDSSEERENKLVKNFYRNEINEDEMTLKNLAGSCKTTTN